MIEKLINVYIEKLYEMCDFLNENRKKFSA